MERNSLAKSLLPGNAVTQEAVGYVAFQNLALTVDASERGYDLVLDSTWRPIHQNPTTTLKVTMALKLCSCVMCFQAGNMSSRLIYQICKVLLRDMIVCTTVGMLEGISIILN